MALCVSLLLWLLSTIHVSLAADDEVAAPAPDPDPAPAAVTLGNALTVKLHEDELTAKEDKKSHRLDPLQHLQDYETAGKLVDEHPKAVRIADKEIKNPLGNFHVHLWAHLGSLPPAFCIPLEKEIPELPPKPLLKALEEVLSSLVNETAADPQIQEKVIEIIKPFEKFRNCCDKYFVFIDVKVPEFKPSEKSLYIWSKIPGHGNEKAGEGEGGGSVEPAIDAPQEPQDPAVKGPEAGETAVTEGGGEGEGGGGAVEKEKDGGKGEETAAPTPGETAGANGEETEQAQQVEAAKEPDGTEGVASDNQHEDVKKGPQPTEQGPGAKEPTANQDQKPPDEQDQEHQRKLAEIKQYITELWVCQKLEGTEFHKIAEEHGGGREVDLGQFADALKDLCQNVDVPKDITERIFKAIDKRKDDQIDNIEWTEWRSKTADEQAKAAMAERPQQ